MSAKEKQVVEVQEKLEDITECPICAETYKEPKILPCIHTFCMICLQETGLKTNKSPGDKMPCPVCRTEFTVPGKGFVGLQRNFFMERLIEMKNILNPSSTRVVCDACQEDSDLGPEAEIPSAEMYCVDCDQRLCGECCRHHRKYKGTKNHRMLPLDGAQINIPSNVKPYVCDKHENKPLEIYCSSCLEAVCALCYFEGHKTHETSPVINVVADFRRIIQEHSDIMMSFILDLKNKITEEDNNRAVFTREVADVESEIKRSRQNLQERVEKDCDSLLQQLNSIKEGRIKENESQLCDTEAVLASLESYQAYCKQVVTIGSDIDICRAMHNLNARAAELKLRYESISLGLFLNIWLKKTEFHDALYQTGNNIIWKIEENVDNKTSNAETKASLIDRISTFVNELNDILDKTSVEEKEDVCHSHIQTVEAGDENKDKSEAQQKNDGKEMEKDTFVEVFETTEMKECDEKISDDLRQLKIKINNMVEKNDKLKHELNFQQERVSRLEKEIISMNRDAEAMKLTEMQSRDDIVNLKKQVTLLSSTAYNGEKTTEVKKTSQHKGGLVFLQTIATVNASVDQGYRVTGLAILDNELFITSTSNVVEVNDLRTLKFKRWWRAEKIETVLDMKSCVRIKCIYLLCSYKVDRWTTEMHMLRFSAEGKVVRQWKPDGLRGGYSQISVTAESNVLLTNESGGKLTEYSPDGMRIRVISLKLESGIEHLVHAIKLTSDQFLVCHGKGQDLLQRVCIVDIDGNVLKYCGEVGESDKLYNPIYLEMAAGGNILVADHLNQRLLLFNSSLEFMNTLSLYRPNPYDFFEIEHRPRKMILDEAHGRLFVAENNWIAPSKGECKVQFDDRLLAFTFSMQ